MTWKSLGNPCTMYIQRYRPRWLQSYIGVLYFQFIMHFRTAKTPALLVR